MEEISASGERTVVSYAIRYLVPESSNNTTTVQPTVIINQHRNTAIVVATSGKKLLVIKLGKGKLTVTPLTIEKIKTQGYITSDYSPKLAAQSYLQHGAGVSERARKYLEKIACGEFSDSLVFT